MSADKKNCYQDEFVMFVTRSNEEALKTTFRVSPHLLIDQYSGTNEIIEAQRDFHQSINKSINLSTT